MGSYYIYILLAVIVLAAGILAVKQGFWEALTKMAAVSLGLIVGMTFVNPVSEIIGESNKFAQVIAMAILLVGTMVLLILFQTRGPKVKKPFLPKQMNIIFAVLLLLLVAVGGLVTVQVFTKFNKNEQAAAAQAANPADPNAANAAAANLPESAGNGRHFSQKAIDAFSRDVPFVAAALIFYLFWCWTGSWVAIDAEQYDMKGKYVWKLTAALVFPLFLTAAYLINVMPVSIGLAVLGYIAPSLTYVLVRNKGKDPEAKVLTPKHLMKLMKGKKGKSSKGEEDVSDGLPIEMTGYGGDVPKSLRQERGAAFAKHPGHVLFAMTVYQAIKRKATAMKLLAGGADLTVHYFLDGCWHPMPAIFAKPISAQETPRVLEALKILIGGNPEETQARQTGRFYMEYDRKGGKKKKMAASAVIQSQGGTEEVLVQFEMLHLRFGTYDRIGMSEKRIEQVQQLLRTDQGMIVFSAPPGHGLRTLTDVALTNADRFTRDFVTVEDEANPYRVIENVVKTTYNSANGENPMTVLKDVFFREPRVLVIRDMVNRETMEMCCREVANQRLIFTTIRAKNSADAILRLLKTGIDPKLLADTLTAVISQRLVRILCPICKDPTTISPEIIRRFGINPMNVGGQCKPHIPEGQEALCPECFGFGFKKRTGIFDIITVSDDMRRVLASNPTEQAIRAAAAKQGEYGFLPDGGRLISWGATSYEELVRCMQ